MPSYLWLNPAVEIDFDISQSAVQHSADTLVVASMTEIPSLMPEKMPQIKTFQEVLKTVLNTGACELFLRYTHML